MKTLVLLAVVLVSSLAVCAQQRAAIDIEKVVMRSTPTAKGRAVRTLTRNTIVEIVRSRGTWTYVRAGQNAGWVPSNSITKVKAVRLDRVTRIGTVNGDSDVPAQIPPPPVPGLATKTLSGGVLNGKAISLPAPVYPPAARAVQAGGAVSVQVLIDEKGNVVSASAVSGHPLLRSAAESAARRALFAPTLLSGQPVKVSGVITYNFVP